VNDNSGTIFLLDKLTSSSVVQQPTVASGEIAAMIRSIWLLRPSAARSWYPVSHPQSTLIRSKMWAMLWHSSIPEWRRPISFTFREFSTPTRHFRFLLTYYSQKATWLWSKPQSLLELPGPGKPAALVGRFSDPNRHMSITEMYAFARCALPVSLLRSPTRDLAATPRLAQRRSLGERHPVVGRFLPNICQLRARSRLCRVHVRLKYGSGTIPLPVRLPRWAAESESRWSPAISDTLGL